MTTSPDSHDHWSSARDGEALDEGALTAWLARIEGFGGPISIERFAGGQSNPTYKLVTRGKTYVLRRKPTAPVVAGAHAIEREARVMTALHRAGFPVPHVHGLCSDESVIGSCFYVMDMVEGRIFWDATLPALPASERAACYDSMNETIGRLHCLDYRALGLADFGRTGSYVARQVYRWSRQYCEDPFAGRDANMDRLAEWLARNGPAQDDTAIIHGDLRIDNMIFHPTQPRVAAVIDWELATLGDPLADFAYNAMAYHMPPHIVAGLAGARLPTLQIPDETEYIAAYCRRTGRSRIADYEFYLIFNFFRLAAIFHGIRGRVLRGNAASADAAAKMDLFAELAEIGWLEVEKLERSSSATPAA